MVEFPPLSSELELLEPLVLVESLDQVGQASVGHVQALAQALVLEVVEGPLPKVLLPANIIMHLLSPYNAETFLEWLKFLAVCGLRCDFGVCFWCFVMPVSQQLKEAYFLESVTS